MVELLEHRVYVANTTQIIDTALVEVLGVEFGVLFELKLGKFLVRKVYVMNRVLLIDFG
jgi:hypothetical protein